MNAKDIIENIKKALNFEDTPTPAVDPATPVVAEAVVYTLADGTEIKVSALEVGGDVTIADVMAPAGTYVLEDKSSIVVDELGKITEIVEKTEEAPAAELPEDLNTEKFEARVLKLESEYQELKATSEQSMAALKEGFAVAEQKIEGQNTIIGQLVALVEQLAIVPSADIPTPKKAFSFSNVETKNKGLSKFAEAAKKLAEENKK